MKKFSILKKVILPVLMVATVAVSASAVTLFSKNKAYASSNNVAVSSLVDGFTAVGASLTVGEGTAPGRNNTYSGIRVDATGDSIITYNNVIDIGGYYYTNKSDYASLIGLAPTPKVKDQAEIQSIKIILTDVLDSANKLNIEFRYVNTSDGAPDGVIDTEGVTHKDSNGNEIVTSNSAIYVWGQTLTATQSNNAYVHGGSSIKYSGAPRCLSFGGYQQEPFKLIYDYSSNTLWGNQGGDKGNRQDCKDSYLIKMLGVKGEDYPKYKDPDLNQAFYVANEGGKGHGDPSLTWDGFLSTKVNVEMNVTLREGVNDASFIITDLFGMDLSSAVNGEVPVNDNVIYALPEALPETTSENSIVVPGAKVINSCLSVEVGELSTTAGDYVGEITLVKPNNSKVKVNVGETITLDKLGLYTLEYKYKKVTIKTSVYRTANLTFDLNGANVLISGDNNVYKDESSVSLLNTVTAYVETNIMDGETPISKSDSYVAEVSLVNLDTGNSTNLTLNKGFIEIDYSILGAENLLVAVAKQYTTVEFSVDGEVIDSVKLKQSDNFVITDKIPTLKGYDFKEWRYEGVKVDETKVVSSVSTSNKIVLDAEFNINLFYATLEIPTRFNGVATLSNKQIYFTVEGIDLPEPTVINPEYKFSGWYLNGKKITSAEDLEAENITLIANFYRNVNVVTFVVDGKTVNEVALLKGEKLTASEYVKEGYKFDGWYLNDSLFNFKDTVITTDVTLVGKFSLLDTSNVSGAINNSSIKSEASVKNSIELGAFEGMGLTAFIGIALTVGGIVVIVIFALKLVKANKREKIIDKAVEGESNEK